MRFSILIPVYNAEQYLGKCFDSIEKQTCLDFEVIIVNDGSTDSSGLVCEEFALKHNNVKVIHQKNSGPLIARRQCVQSAIGEYCIYLDSDDFIDENMIKELNTIIMDKAPDVILISSLKYRDGSISIHKKPLFESNRYIKENEKDIIYKKTLRREISNALWSKVFKRSLFDFDKDYSYFSKCNIGEDLLQSLPIITRANTFYYLSRPVYYYRTTSGSLTQKYNENMYDSLFKVNCELDKYVMIWGENAYESDAAFRYLVDVYDVIISSFRCNDKLKYIELIEMIGNSSYFRRKYELAEKKYLSRRQKFIVECIYKHRVSRIKAYKNLLFPLIEMYRKFN